MAPFKISWGTRAFTLVEMLVVIAIIGILAALLMPVLNKSESRAKRIVCENQLQQIGLAFHAFSNDHSGKFPMAVSTNEGGSMEYVENGFDAPGPFYTSFHHFQALSNELVFPRILVCQADLQRTAASNYPDLENENVSYFVGVNSTFDKPTSILAGDRNVATNSYLNLTILQVGATSRLWWTADLHQFQGNVLIADGHVEEWNDSTLSSAAGELPDTESLFLPSVLQPYSPYGGNGGSYNGSGYNPSPGANPSGPATQSNPQMPSTQSSPSAGMISSSDAKVSNESGQASANVQATPTISSDQNDDTVLPGASDGGMSPVNRHLARSLRHFMIVGYSLLWLLLLFYLGYKLRKGMRERAAKQRMKQMRSAAHTDSD